MRSKRLLVLPAIALAVLLSGCHTLRYYNDVAITRDGNGDVFAFVLRDTDFGNVSSDEFDAWDTIYNDLNANCGPSGNDANGDWGTPGSGMDLPDSVLVECVQDHIIDDPGDEEDPASLVCDDEDLDHDCQEGETYVVVQDATEFYYEAVTDSGDALDFVTAIRDWPGYHSTQCLGYTASAPTWTFYSICPS